MMVQTTLSTPLSGPLLPVKMTVIHTKYAAQEGLSALGAKGRFIRASFTVSLGPDLASPSVPADRREDCNVCDRGEFDLCHRCYETSGGCANKSHVLMRYNSFEKLQSMDIPYSASCDVQGCGKALRSEGTLYFCETCKPRNGMLFAICHSCYGSGAGCFSRNHSFTKRRRTVTRQRSGFGGRK